MKHAFVSPGFGALIPYVTKNLTAGTYTLSVAPGNGSVVMFTDRNTAVFGPQRLTVEQRTFVNGLQNDWVTAGNRPTSVVNEALQVGPATNNDRRFAAFPRLNVEVGDRIEFIVQVKIISGSTTPTSISGVANFQTFWGAEASGTVSATTRRDVGDGWWEYQFIVEVTTLGNGILRGGLSVVDATQANDTTVLVDNADAFHLTGNLEVISTKTFTLSQQTLVHFRPVGDVGTLTLKQDAPRNIYVGGQGGLSAIGSYWMVGIATLNGEGDVKALGSRLFTVSVKFAGLGNISPLGGLLFSGKASLGGLSEFISTGHTFIDVGIVLITMPPPYRVVIADLDGVEIDEVPFKNLAFSETLNDEGTIDFTMPLKHKKSTRDLLDPGKREIIVYRNTERVWGGYLWDVNASSSQEDIRIAGAGYLSRLFRRYVDTTIRRIDVEQIDIAWDLIAQTQNKDSLGITRAETRPTGVKRTRRYRAHERTLIADALQELTEIDDGFDFEIDANKKFHTYFPQKGAPSDVVFELGKNIGNISYLLGARDVVSEVTGLGAGDGAKRCIAVYTDSDTQAEYGVLEAAEDFNEIKHYRNLLGKAKLSQKLRRRATWQPQLTVYTNDPTWGAYELGDRPTVRADSGYIQVDKRFRIVSMLTQLTDEGREVRQLFFDEELAQV